MRARRLPVVSLLVVTGLALAACSSTTEQVADEVNAKVETTLERDDVTTTCPDDAEATEGATFVCTVSVDDQELTADIEFTSDDEFTYTFNGDAFDKPLLEESIIEQAEQGFGLVLLELDCGGTDIVLISSEDTIECTGTADDDTTGTAVVGLDADGNAELRELLPE